VNEHADILITHGHLFTMQGEGVGYIPDGAVAVIGSRIAAVGPTVELAGRFRADRVIEARDCAVLPGLIDAHNHFQVMGQLHSAYVSFIPPEVRTIADMQDKLAETVARTASGEWIKGYYLAFQEGRVPTRADLDPVSPDHPVFILQQGGHFGTGNSRALQVAGITRDSVMVLARELGHTVVEQVLPREFLYIADEVFFTGTAAEITPVRSIDGIAIGSGRRGPITAALQEAFFSIVEGQSEDRYGWLTVVGAEG